LGTPNLPIYFNMLRPPPGGFWRSVRKLYGKCGAERGRISADRTPSRRGRLFGSNAVRLRQSEKRRHQHQPAPADRRRAKLSFADQLVKLRPTQAGGRAGIGDGAGEPFGERDCARRVLKRPRSAVAAMFRPLTVAHGTTFPKNIHNGHRASSSAVSAGPLSLSAPVASIRATESRKA